ncbi:hypothetical protein SNK04_002100 [Fusarium graminearum]
MSNVSPVRLSVALLLLSATTVLAADDEKDNTDFLLNVFSDIGPILALFGEQFARQFLSETFTWEDHIIFACIPLGIMTAISGAIRVQGNGLFRAVIGRARENHAAAEIEYMSSTSTEVCELYNGEGIVRTMGKPFIGQIIVCPDQFPNGNSCGIHTLETAKKDQIMEYQDYQLESRPRLFKWFGPSSMPTNVKKNQMKPEMNQQRDLESCPTEEQSIEGSDRNGPRQVISTGPEIPQQQRSKNSGRQELHQGTLSNGRSPPSRHDTSRTLMRKGHKSEKKNPWLTLRSPNLQLNIPCKDVSEKKHHYHLVLAAIVALVLQVALLAIAVSTVYFISGFDPEPWGLPCYLGGSILLFFGMLACSVAIEKRTRELTWYRPGVGEDPKEFYLLWIQRNQRVSEQDFGSLVIDGGTRRHLMTSSREEDLEGLERIDQTADGDSNRQTGTTNPSFSQHQAIVILKLLFLKLLPLIAVSFGGIGFTVQFIGLRGLPWPCAVSQLGAMIIMAIIRALIRRRLANPLNHRSVLEKHELDYLAIQLVEKDGKLFEGDPKQEVDSVQILGVRARFWSALYRMVGNRGHQTQQLPTEVLVWKVDTTSNLSFKPISKLDLGTTELELKLTFGPDLDAVRTLPNIARSEDNFTDKGQATILVRKRLGDLCKWPDSTSKLALALTRSIESFLKEFFPNGLPTHDADQLMWKIPFSDSHQPDPTTPSKSANQTAKSWIKLHATRDPNTKGWIADNGQIEAILSLWVAHWTARQAAYLEAERQESGVEGQNTDWRRASDGSHVEYCRKIGQDRNGVLKRDISWWVSNAVGGLQREDPNSREGPHGDASSGSRFSFGFSPLIYFEGSSSSATSIDSELYASPETERVSFRTQSSDILVQHSTADLVTVMAQHLFTCFIWNIGSLLPRNIFNREDININEIVTVESSGSFDQTSSTGAYSVQKISHRQLTKFVNYAEKQGLGTFDDILLCIIPTFSFFDCLPNNVILDYNQFDHKPFRSFKLSTQSVKCLYYIDLLDCIRKENDMQQTEYLSVAAVVITMEFVYFMALHNIRSKACGIPGETYPIEFKDLLEILLQRFGAIISQLSPFYGLQRRRETLKSVFSPRRIRANDDDVWSSNWNEQRLNKAFMHNIRFTKWHRKVADFKNNRPMNLITLLLREKNGMERDIFGWTPLHYAAARPDLKFVPEKGAHYFGPPGSRLEITLNDNFERNRWVDKFRRSPVHIAAAAGNINFLEILLPCLHNDAKLAICRGDIDEMSPLHLAAQGNHENCKRDEETNNPSEGNSNRCIITLLQHWPEVHNGTDAWKQSPIHMAVTKQCYECALSLLNSKRFDFNPKKLDEFKHPLLFYLKAIDRQHCLIGRELLLKHYHKFEFRNTGADNILHHAVRLLERTDLRVLLDALHNAIPPHLPTLNVDAVNKRGQTPLHLAVLSNKPGLVTCLVEAGASASVLDTNLDSPMIIACQFGYAVVAESLLDDPNYRGSEVDKKGRTALHHAASSWRWPSDSRRIEIVERLLNAMESVDVLDHEGETPLQSAVIANRKSVCLTLLRKNANILLVHINRLSALDKIVQSIPETEQFRTMWQNQTRKVTKERANDQDPNGDTALHKAVYREDYETVDWLMRNGANLNIVNYSGRTAFIEACRQNKCRRFIRQLVDVFNSLGPRSTWRPTPQHEAEMTIQQLGSSAEWPWCIDSNRLYINDGDTISDRSPLAWACEGGLEMVVKILLQAKEIDVGRKATKCDNYTPLHFALASKNHAIVQLLLDYPGERVVWTEPDENGFTAIQFAMRNPDKDCLYKLLMHHNVHPNELSYDDPGAVLRVCSGCNIQAIDWVLMMSRLALDENTVKTFLDADNWTLADIAGKYGHPNLQRYLQDKIENSSRVPPPPLQPSKFLGTYSGLLFRDGSTPGEVRTVNMEPIPPNDEGFYFEVKLRHLPGNQVFMIGFCGAEIPIDRAPGWDPGSWAYHTDDGGLFEGDGHAVISNPEHICKEGDVIGCGVKFDTGKGYRTRNGVSLDSGDAFRDGWLKVGKLYPCVGFRDDGYGDKLKVEITLPGSGKLSYEKDLSHNG